MTITLPSISPGLGLSLTPNTPRPLPVDFLEILENWRIPNLDCSAILPPTFITGTWSDALLEAVRQLSSVTVGQRERAHSLLNTYLQARIREGSYRGKNHTICATLEVEDVDKATQSICRMSKGQALESIEPAPGTEAYSASSKRKYSIRHESEAPEEPPPRPDKLPKIDTSHAYHDMSLSAILAPTPPALPSPSPSLSFPPTPPAKLQSCQKRTVRLPPIKTHDINMPTLPVASAYAQHPAYEPLVQAAQRATHEFNVRRVEFANVEVQYEVAKRAYVEAARRMEMARARARVREWR